MLPGFPGVPAGKPTSACFARPGNGYPRGVSQLPEDQAGVSDLPQEPGLDRHAWASEYESIEPLIRDDPEEALPLLADLVERMMNERGEDPTLGRAFNPSEESRQFDAAMELVARGRGGEDLPPGDVAFAVDSLREVYFELIGDVSER
jgi:hypothetical protein